VNPATNESSLISPDQPALRRLKPRKNTVELTHGTLDGIESVRLTGYLRNALEHCSLAHSGTAQKIQFVNLWSAMECLAASKRSGACFRASLRNCRADCSVAGVDKTSQYLAIALHDFRFNGASCEIGGAFPAGKKFVSPGWLMLTLTKPENQSGTCLIFSNSQSPHPLLCNRVKMMWDSLHDPIKLSGELKMSKQRP